jgi:hypothetical protein
MMLRLTDRSGTRLNDWSQSAILGDRGAVARNFADLVAARMVGTVLPFSERESLVKAAARHGINRFEANLLIAAVQNQMGAGRRRVEKRGRGQRFGSLTRAIFATLRMKFSAAVQNLWRVGRQWAIAKRVWPGSRISSAIADIQTRIVAAVQNRPEFVRQHESARMRISSALATFVAVQAGIVAAAWYLFSY